jgi:hypothetical protein
MYNPQLRILFLHGLESGKKGRKARFLKEHFPLTAIPHLRHPHLLFPSLYVAITALRSYQPALLIGSSYGAFLALFLMQMGVWRGPAILLAQAMGIIFPRDRLWLPRHIPACILVHGTNDTTCPIEASRRIYAGAFADDKNQRIQLWEVEDGHSLNKAMLDEKKLFVAIAEVMARVEQRTSAAGKGEIYTNEDYVTKTGSALLLLRCTLALLGSALQNLPVLLWQLSRQLWRKRGDRRRSKVERGVSNN